MKNRVICKECAYHSNPCDGAEYHACMKKSKQPAPIFDPVYGMRPALYWPHALSCAKGNPYGKCGDFAPRTERQKFWDFTGPALIFATIVAVFVVSAIANS